MRRGRGGVIGKTMRWRAEGTQKCREKKADIYRDWEQTGEKEKLKLK